LFSERSGSVIMSIMDAAQALELYEIAEAGRAAARTHQPDAEKPLEGRYPDVLAALRWHVDRGDVGEGLRFANVLVTFWLGTNRIPDGDDWFGRLLTTSGEADTTRALALHEHGYLVFWAGSTTGQPSASASRLTSQPHWTTPRSRRSRWRDSPVSLSTPTPTRRSGCCAKPSTSPEPSPRTTPEGRARCTSWGPPCRCPAISRAPAR
jgi:hypothetical protein